MPEDSPVRCVREPRIRAALEDTNVVRTPVAGPTGPTQSHVPSFRRTGFFHFHLDFDNEVTTPFTSTLRNSSLE